MKMNIQNKYQRSISLYEIVSLTLKDYIPYGNTTHIIIIP